VNLGNYPTSAEDTGETEHNQCTDDRLNHLTEEPTGINTQCAEQKTADYCADDTKGNIAPHAESSTSPDFTGEPARNQANQQPDYKSS
jgi:hypothetical protein